jgi:nitrate/nitrite transporter NarK
MQDNALQNNPLAFFAGLVLFFAGLLVALFYLIVRTATETTILPGHHFRLKHFILALVVAAAGAVLASFARPRGSAMSDRTSFNG